MVALCEHAVTSQAILLLKECNVNSKYLQMIKNVFSAI